jgi:hypothetical protein
MINVHRTKKRVLLLFGVIHAWRREMSIFAQELKCMKEA